ncbi:STY4534 family ICE replication protein [Pseudomonas asiatica]|uniref:STY4534 family ICE replication protein n=1 Tax=Pseudomonas asiatica TaxID=2219225 RepID=A0ABU5KVX4_9PSED|nr:STY4534 family ICE replication protein [Pseudomonas asiatica]MDZ5738077.1 STY4534 family ICE replication protein [Pseudomonas asiatica]MDZ5744673.1 STY4534 family ICE replication protein [Pseudomonas asiatica]MDZ5748833.1 STY4534 family ICE replication protein [Pseudomonas asiatica]MDZ5753165.1 STY4534 family ICE replication protein [Pseudomonas asiatica]
MSNQSNEAKFFDLHTTGIGYLNRIREVKPRGKGKPFWAVTVAALRGSTDNAEYTYIDCNAVGAEAETLIKRCQQAVEAGKKVLVSFRIGDMWADAFTYEKGEKKGQAGASLKGRLLFIGWIKVDGNLVYEAKPKNTTPTADRQGQPGMDQPLNQEQPASDQFGEQPQPDLGSDLSQEAHQAA